MKEIKTLDELKSLSGRVVIDVWAPWCGPCRKFAPIFEKVATNNALPDMTYIKINIDESSELANYFHIMSIPTILYLKNGEEVHRDVGSPDSPENFASNIRMHLAD